MYDLEDRTLKLAITVRTFTRRLPVSIINQEDTRQLIRSSGSIGANYIEANESLSRKDFLMRLKISRKEAKETIYWLKIIKSSVEGVPELLNDLELLIQETSEIRNILSAIIKKSSS